MLFILFPVLCPIYRRWFLLVLGAIQVNFVPVVPYILFVVDLFSSIMPVSQTHYDILLQWWKHFGSFIQDSSFSRAWFHFLTAEDSLQCRMWCWFSGECWHHGHWSWVHRFHLFMLHPLGRKCVAALDIQCCWDGLIPPVAHFVPSQSTILLVPIWNHPFLSKNQVKVCCWYALWVPLGHF